MSYYNDEQNKIRRRKVSSSDLKSKSSKTANSNEEKKEINNIKKERKNISRSNQYKKEVKSKSKSRSKKRKNKSKLLNIAKRFLVTMLLMLAVVSVLASSVVLITLKDSPKVTKELLESKYISSQVVSNDEIPKYLKEAVVSIEDERFYKHNGVDEISLLRSFIHNLFTDTTQGGSTIEMQISKNLLTSDDKTMKRKIKDIYNAISMDKNMTKEDILGVYLNNIYLGKSSYGVGKGAKVYFGKNIDDLNLAECAMLAGITNNPAKYSQYREAKKRQETILYKMHELGYINDEEYNNALSEKVTFESEIG